MTKISAVIITKNEESNIIDCLQTLDFADEVIIVDSESNDKTISLAKSYTNKIYTRKWNGYAAQKNYGISRAKNEWILSLDADERISEELKREIKSLKFDYEGYLLPIKNYFLGKWLKYGGQYPDHHLRLFKKSKGRFSYGIKEVHETVNMDKDMVVKLRTPVLHYSYNSVSAYFHKFNLYTYLEASGRFCRRKKPSWYGIFIRPATRFFKYYFVKLGFLDGIRGLLFHSFSAVYVFASELKLFEIYKFDKKEIRWKS
ncbi:MAG: glycosyltransferase family 2 protein [Candidatus Firestonebacteria bacterium]